MRTIGLGIALGIVIGILVSGCGGGDTTVSAAERAKAEYIKEADETCTEQNRQIQRKMAPYLEQETGGNLPPRIAREMVTKVVIPDLEYEIRSIRAIVLPQRDLAEVARFLAAMDKVASRANSYPVGFTRAGRPFFVPERLGEEYGFTVCGHI